MNCFFFGLFYKERDESSNAARYHQTSESPTKSSYPKLCFLVHSGISFRLSFCLFRVYAQLKRREIAIGDSNSRSGDLQLLISLRICLGDIVGSVA